jgi:L-alanine-DL-glutamate epimerase-like enolase superfamily enzyme
MQITRVEVVPITLKLRLPYRTAYHGAEDVNQTGVVFVRIETRQGNVAWGCAAFDPAITGETLDQVTQACHACADRARDLNPLNLEYALSELSPLTEDTPSAQCAFDIAFHDLLGLATGLPIHRLLGGYRDRIQTSITVSLGSVKETVERAQNRVRQGFRILKIKGGVNPEEDVRRVKAVHDALPNITLRLDADGGYTVAEALDVARALEGCLEMLEQPVSTAGENASVGDLRRTNEQDLRRTNEQDLRRTNRRGFRQTKADEGASVGDLRQTNERTEGIHALRHVTEHSPIPILADQSVVGPSSALEIAGQHAADGISIKLATCGGLRCARQMDAIACAAHISTMVGCVHEPALLIAAELAFALSSPSVQYGDLDGHFDLIDDPTRERFTFADGWLIASDVPGLGCTVDF